MILSWSLIVIGALFILNGIPAMIFGAGGIFYIFLGAVIVFFGRKLLRKNKNKINNIKHLDKNALANADYSHVYEDFAIGISERDRKVYLAENGKSKTYDFSDIRSWRYNLESGGAVINGGMAGVARTIGQDRMNKMASGFFVQVRDIDNPEWQIRFPHDSEQKKNLLRWMEIFDQKVNNR